ncbi:CaiB/BaiF CoA transferase family protein [Streptomyces sp. NPDC002577]
MSSSQESESRAVAGPLTGLRVLDFSTLIAGPYCTRLLADLGADVVKIESPSGDFLRSTTPLRDGHSAYFGMMNAGKRCITLDLRVPEGLSVARDLMGWADVVVENFRPGVMKRFGLDYDTVSVDHPQLVYCSISGYGQTGPWINRPATAQAVHAISGYDLANLRYQLDEVPPPSTGVFAADGLSGALAFGAVLTALRGRDTDGVGRHIDLALLDSMLSMMPYEVQEAQFPQGYDRKGYPPARTSDGWVMVAATNQRNFEALTRAIGSEELAEDERFRATEARWLHTRELHKLVEQWTSTRTSAECEATFLEAGVPAARYRTIAEQFDTEQLRQRGTFVPAVDAAGEFQVVAPAFQLRVPGEASPRPVATAERPLRVSSFGADTKAVLTELLGAEVAEAAITSGAAVTDAP